MNQNFEKFKQAEPLSRPLIMGILNVTPDSFSDGGRNTSVEAALQQVELMIEAGVDVVDIGGESTRPGATPVSLEEELDRILPVIEAIKQRYKVPISVDTYKPEVMSASLLLGVEMINDINALQAPGALEAVSASDAMVCLMHKQGRPENMQDAPNYSNVVDEVLTFLSKRVKAANQGGVKSDRIVLDPGFGFGKTFEHNVTLFEQLDRLIELGLPVLVGVSRKQMIGQLMSGAPVEQRMIGSVSAAVIATLKGAQILRVHDVAETRQAVEVALALV